MRNLLFFILFYNTFNLAFCCIDYVLNSQQSLKSRFGYIYIYIFECEF